MLRTDLPVLTVLDGRDVTLRSFDMGRYTVHASLPEFARIAMARGAGTASGFSGYYHLEALTHPLGGPVPRLSADERRPWPWLPELNPFLIAAHSSEKDQLCLVVDGMEQPVADPALGSWLRVLPELSTSTRPLQDPLAILTCNEGAAHQQLADSLGRLVWFAHGETEIWGERDSVGRNQVRVGLHRTQDGHGGQFRSTYPLGPAGDRVRWAYRSRFGSNPTRWLVERSAPPGSPIPVGLRPHPFGGKHLRGLSYFDRRDWRSRSPALNASVLGSSHVAWTPNDAYRPGTPTQTGPARGSLHTTALPWHSGDLGELPFGPEDVAVVVSYFASGRFAVYDERHDLSYWETPLSFGMRLRKDLAAAGEPAPRPIPSRVLLLTDYEAVPDVARSQVARGLGVGKLITVNTPSTLFLNEDSKHGIPTARIALLPATGGVSRPGWTATTPAGISTSLSLASRHHTGGGSEVLVALWDQRGGTSQPKQTPPEPVSHPESIPADQSPTARPAPHDEPTTDAPPPTRLWGSDPAELDSDSVAVESDPPFTPRESAHGESSASTTRLATQPDPLTERHLLGSAFDRDGMGWEASSRIKQHGVGGFRSTVASSDGVGATRGWIDRSGPIALSDDELKALVDRIPDALADPELALCGPGVSWLVRALYPDGVRVVTASDDNAPGVGGVRGQQQRLVAGPGWARVHDLDNLYEVVGKAAGSTAVILASRAGDGLGHALALHTTTDGASRAGGLRWVDPQRSRGPQVVRVRVGDQQFTPTAVRNATAVWAVVIDAHGRVLGLGDWSAGPTTTREAILDAPLSHKFGAHSEEDELGEDFGLPLLSEADPANENERKEVLSRLGAGDVVSLWHATDIDGGRNWLDEARTQLTKVYPGKSLEDLDADLNDMIEGIKKSRVTVNFDASKVFSQVSATSPGLNDRLLNSWEKGKGTFSGENYRKRRDRTEHLAGQINQHEPHISSDSTAFTKVRHRLWTYLSNDSESFDKSARPKYGALDYARNSNGGASLYGESFVVVKEHVKHRSTYTGADSMDRVGDNQELYPATILNLEKLLATCELDDLKKIHDLMISKVGFDLPGDPEAGYFEAQIYTDVTFANDVSEISIQEDEFSLLSESTMVKEQLKNFAAEHGIRLNFRSGDAH